MNCPEEIYHLGKMVKELGLINDVANELGIKPSSLKRQLSRIEAYYEHKPVQKRSGSRKNLEYITTMRKVLENNTGRPIFGCPIKTPRRVEFDRLSDALIYSYPISHISSLIYDFRKKKWVVLISIKSKLPISPYDA